jgi:CRISPR/Cas system-associated endonuclease Cas1
MAKVARRTCLCMKFEAIALEFPFANACKQQKEQTKKNPKNAMASHGYSCATYLLVREVRRNRL